MNGRPNLITWSASAVLAVAGWAFAPAATAACACMCVDEVAYEVCTGIVTTQSITEECTAQLECPAVGEEPTQTEEPEAPVEPPATAGGEDLDCRTRQVYRPDIGEYKPHKVCMPARFAEAHERQRARRAATAARYAERHDRERPGHRRHDPDWNEWQSSRGDYDWRHQRRHGDDD